MDPYNCPGTIGVVVPNSFMYPGKLGMSTPLAALPVKLASSVCWPTLMARFFSAGKQMKQAESMKNRDL